MEKLRSKSRVELKEKIKNRKITIGSWITLSHLSVAEILAKEDFDWLVVDMEHSAITLHQAQQLIQIIELSKVAPLVRVGENNPNLIKRVMDCGAHGVVVPMVNSKEDAIKAVKAVKYPPRGSRGVGLARAQGYGLEFEKYRNWVNKSSIVVVQIEHIDAINNLESILKIKDVDASIIGPYDLSASLGYPGEFNRKEVRNAINRYKVICNRLKKPSGFHVIPPKVESLREKIEEGFKFIGFSLDTLFLGTTIRDNMKDIRSGLKEKS